VASERIEQRRVRNSVKERQRDAAEQAARRSSD
jgi:hypothetical protein